MVSQWQKVRRSGPLLFSCYFKTISLQVYEDVFCSPTKTRQTIYRRAKTLANSYRFRNTVTDTLENDCPPPFHGGILADPPGLGKSLTMLSLVSRDLSLSAGSEESPSGVEPPATQAHSTLIVVPPACKLFAVQFFLIQLADL